MKHLILTRLLRMVWYSPMDTPLARFAVHRGRPFRQEAGTSSSGQAELSHSTSSGAPIELPSPSLPQEQGTPIRSTLIQSPTVLQPPPAVAPPSAPAVEGVAGPSTQPQGQEANVSSSRQVEPIPSTSSGASPRAPTLFLSPGSLVQEYPRRTRVNH